MANLFDNLPATAGNGVGAAVDLSAYGATKTFIISGVWDRAPIVTVEMNDDAGQSGSWAPVGRSVQGAGQFTISVVGKWFRVKVAAWKGGSAPDVNVGGNDNGTLDFELVCPPSIGNGAAVDISTLGPLKTACVQNAFDGALIIEFSTDGASDWSTGFSFPAPGQKSGVVVAKWARVKRLQQGGGTLPLVFLFAEIPPGGGSPPVGDSAVIFDDATPGDNVNIRSDRASDQSPIDNTKIQITNLGSADGSQNPSATGATADAATIGGGNDNTASGDYSTVAGGDGNTASGLNSSVGGGVSNVASDSGATVAGGTSNTASGLVSTVLGGQGCIASGENSVAGGLSSVASGDWAVAIGESCTADEDDSFACNYGSTASGPGSFACNGATALDVSGFACNDSTSTSPHAHSQGFHTNALRFGQSATGSATDPSKPYGSSQTSVMTLYGATPGAAINETAVLNAGAIDGVAVPELIILEDNKTYAFKVTMIAGGVQAGPVNKSRVIVAEFCARRVGGTTVLVSGVAPPANVSYGDVTAAWTLTPSVGAGPDRLVFTFSTGAVISACKVTAKVEFTEVLFV